MTKTRSELEFDTSGVLRPEGLSRPLPAGRILVPGSIDLGEWGIHWWWFDNDSSAPQEVRAQRGMLDSFIRLRAGSDEQILKFARRWGVLELCTHVLPACHSPDCQPMSCGDHRYCEPPGAWRRHAAMMYTILTAASQVLQGKVRSPIDWECVTGLFPHFRDARLFKRSGIRAERQRVEAVLNILSEAAGVRPIVRFENAIPRVELIGGFRLGCGLYGALVAQLMLACVASDGVDFCSNCGMPYPANRRPNPTRRKYCQKCREERVPARDAARDYRSRSR